jgi:hypothetical protein
MGFEWGNQNMTSFKNAHDEMITRMQEGESLKDIHESEIPRHPYTDQSTKYYGQSATFYGDTHFTTTRVGCTNPNPDELDGMHFTDPMFAIYTKPGPKWDKYGELSVLQDVKKYISKTYDGHYTNKENDIQSLDVWKARGSFTDTCIDTTIKYLIRYGKKDGKQESDLIKACHYILLAIANERK